MMKFPQSSLLALLMLLAAASAAVLQPRHPYWPEAKLVKLEALVPKSFGDWHAEENASTLVVNPQVSEELEAVYSDTLARTYINQRGERIMLSLAYSQIQSRALQVHKPEVCYVTQGYQIGTLTKVNISAANRSIPVVRLTARLGKRVEPITYWIRSGDDIITSWLEQNKTRIIASFKGVIPDGFLVRVSSISTDDSSAYAAQELFIKDLLAAIKPEYQKMFLGIKGTKF